MLSCRKWELKKKYMWLYINLPMAAFVPADGGKFFKKKDSTAHLSRSTALPPPYKRLGS